MRHAFLCDQIGDYNIYSLLDMHQDVLTSRFHSGYDYDGSPLWLINKTQPRRSFPTPFKKLTAWSEGYLTEAIGQCFQVNEK